MNLDQIAALLLGAAFGSRALNSNKSLVGRLGYALVSYDLVSGALSQEAPVLFGAQGQAQVPNSRTPLQFQERRARDIAERVKYVHEQMMKGVRDTTVYSLARQVLSRKNSDGSWVVEEKDHWGEAVALFNEVKSRVRYTWDPLWYDAFQTPGKTLRLGTGDCDDYMSLLGAMLISVGLNVRSRIVQTVGETTWNHIYAMVFIPEEKTWKPLDLSVKQPAGWEVPTKLIVKHRDFEVLEKSAPRIRAMAGS